MFSSVSFCPLPRGSIDGSCTMTLRTQHTMHVHRALVVVAAAVSLASGAVHAQHLYSNASNFPDIPALWSFATASNTTPAPSGFMFDEMQGQGGYFSAVAGFACHPVGDIPGFRIADDVVVNAPGGWVMNALVLYAYVPENTLPNPFAGVTLNIWNGPPGDPNASKIWGDSVTNVMTSAQATNLYRIFSSIAHPGPIPPDLTRRIWEVRINLGGIVLPPSTYWFDWQITATDPNGMVFCPAATLPGVRTRAAWNGRQLQRSATGAQWVTAMDHAKPVGTPATPQDFVFRIEGTVNTNFCNPDYNQDGGGDTSDVIDLANDIAAGRMSFPPNTTDFNNDGGGDTTDIIDLANVVAGASCP